MIKIQPPDNRRRRRAKIPRRQYDITERKRLEQAAEKMRLLSQDVRRQAKEQERLIQSTAEGIYGIDLNGNCTFCNSAILQLLGYQHERDFIGKNIHDLAHHTRPDGTPYPVDECRIYQAFRSNERCHVDDEVFWRADGSSVPVEYWSYPVIENGCVTGCVVSVVDITERQAILDLLQQSKKLAEEAAATKSRFLAAASHDLRQPLQSLGLYLSVLTSQLDQSTQQEISDKMRQSLDTMGELLDALLDISMLEGGSITPKEQDFRIRGLIDRIVANNIQQAEQKGLKLECTGADWVVHSDPALIERIIENFVTDAIRYTDRGQVSIDCQGRDDVVRIAVSDTGIGIPKDSLDKIFEEYFQLDNPMRDRRKGLGLGLSIVSHIARLLNYPIDVTSVLGEGSTFSVELPLGTSKLGRVKPRTPAEAVLRVNRETVVLLVDDEPAIVDATTMLLKSAGVQVLSALNGNDALAQIEAGVRPDIVISDYRLPGDTGVEVIQRIRQATVDDLPAVLMTGDTSLLEIAVPNLSNCTILHKPVKADQLISLIENLAT